MVKPAIFQIVGFQNSGKTTFIEKLLAKLQNKALLTVTIKHHGHGGRPQTCLEKDSSRHIQSGAIASLVEGDGYLLLEAGRKEWNLEEKIALVSFFSPDLILIEGHKYENFPKAVLIRRKEDLILLEELQLIKVIYYWDESLVDTRLDHIATFHIDDEAGLEWLVAHLQTEARKSSNKM